MVKIYKYIFIFIISHFCFSNTDYIDVITTNDLHGFIDEQTANFINPNYPPHIIGGSGFSKYVSDLKNESDNNLLILDGGNFFQGHPVGIVDSGKTIVDWMNRVGYHATVPGNNDFLFGIKNLINLSKRANFDFLASNLYDKNSNKLIFKPYEVYNIKGVKIAVIGIVNSNLENIVLEKNLKNVNVLNPSLGLIYSLVDMIDKDIKPDIKIILTSLGVPWDRKKEYDKILNEFTNDIKLVHEKGLYNPLDSNSIILFKQKFLEEKKYDLNKYLDDTKILSLLNSTLKYKIELDFFDFDNALSLGFHLRSSMIDLIVSGGISKGYPTPWYDPVSHVYTFQNYGNGTSFGHFKINFDINTNLFTGFDYSVEKSISQTLFLNDFDYNQSDYNWIKSKTIPAIDEIYKPINWDDVTLNSGKYIDVQIESENNWNIPSFDRDENLDIITWNCEFFPAAGDSTIDALSEAVLDLDVDIIAFQEIKNRGWFSKLMKKIPNYDFIISEQSSFMDQAIIYKKEDFVYVSHLELFAENDYNFAGRPPLQVNLIHKKSNTKFSVVDLHMKCCDSGLLRRKRAAEQLYNYLIDHIESNPNVIVLGDWNDDLKDADGEHCFDLYLDDSSFLFPTMDITYDISKASYPKEPYVSFLDHIMITSDFIGNKRYVVDTVPMDFYMGNFKTYETYISDHMPVYLSFPFKN